MLPPVTASYEIDISGLEDVFDLWLCGRPALIGTDVYVLINVRGPDPSHTAGIHVLKGENFGAGTWTNIYTIEGDLLGWLHPADTYCDGHILYVLYASPDETLNLIGYDPESATWTPYSAPLSQDGLTRAVPDSIRLVRRGSPPGDGPGDFIAVWTLRGRDVGDTFVPNTVYAASNSGISSFSTWETPVNLTPDFRPFDAAPWTLADALIGSDDRLHVLAYSADDGHQQAQMLYASMLSDGTLSSSLVLPDYEARTDGGAESPRGVVFGGRVYFPVIFDFGPDEPYSNEFLLPVLISADEFTADDWNLSLYSSDSPDHDITDLHSTVSVTALGQAFSFYPAPHNTSALFYISEFTSGTPGTSALYFPDGAPGDSVDASMQDYRGVIAAVMPGTGGITYVGFASISEFNDSGDVTYKAAFRIVQMGGVSPIGPASRYRGIN